MRRALLGVVLPLSLLVLAALGVGGWYYSEQLLPAPAPFEPESNLTVTDVDPGAGTVTLAGENEDAHLPHIGLVTDGTLLVTSGEPIVAEGTTTRTVRLVDGEWPEVGQPIATVVDTFWGDPSTTLGLPFDRIEVSGELGAYPAWRVVPSRATTDDTWVVVVHGRGGSLSEGNRLLPLFDELGLPALSISVRNDPDAPADPDGYGYFGAEEWRDLEAAVDHLVEVEGAERVVLVGYSQGASSSLSLLRRSDRAELVVGAVLVSPLVSLQETLSLQASERGIPDAVIPPLLLSTRWISSLRSGLDFAQVEHAATADELPGDVPILLTHGTGDTTIPDGPTRLLAERLGPQATFEEYVDVEHVREWNADAERFESDVRALLEAVTG